MIEKKVDEAVQHLIVNELIWKGVLLGHKPDQSILDWFFKVVELSDTAAATIHNHENHHEFGPSYIAPAFCVKCGDKRL